MLRQSNEQDSPFVYLALTPTGVDVAYSEGGDPNNIAHVSGSNTTAPVYLKLERKEGSVLVYESDDDINFSLIMTIALTIGSPFNSGLASSTTNSQVEAQFNEVLVQETTPNTGLDASFTATVVEGEAPLTVVFDASASTGAGELSYEWWFGNGGTASGIEVEHTYNYSGDFVAVLVVSDDNSTVSATQLIKVTSDKDAGTLQLPYSINEDDLGVDNEAIWIGFNTVKTDYVSTVPVGNYKTGKVTFLNLVDGNEDSIADDVVLPDIKENVHFDAANTVRANALLRLFQEQVPSDDLIAIYPLIDQHSSFLEAVDKVKELKGLRVIGFEAQDPDLFKLIGAIGVEVAQKYFLDNNIISPDQLNNIGQEVAVAVTISKEGFNSATAMSQFVNGATYTKHCNGF